MEFLLETASLLPCLYVAYLAIEWLEARSGTLERLLGRSRRIGPAVAAVLGIVPQCGFSAAAASLYAGGVVTAGTLAAAFLSTSDEMLPVLVSSRLDVGAIARILVCKTVGAIAAGIFFDVIVRRFAHSVSPEEGLQNGQGAASHSPRALCSHSRCGCLRHHNMFRSALVHTIEVFFFILVVAGAIELVLHLAGDDILDTLWLNRPWVGEMSAGVLGLVPNCAVSAAAAKLFADGAIGFGPLMASSFTGCGVGLVVLFRTNRNLKENLCILSAIYVAGVLLGRLSAVLPI